MSGAVFIDPLRDIPLLMVVADALELDLLRFSLELFVFAFVVPFMFVFCAGFVVLVRVEVREPTVDLGFFLSRVPLVLVMAALVPLIPFCVELFKVLVDDDIDELILL